jgi:hypothetical protein
MRPAAAAFLLLLAASPVLSQTRPLQTEQALTAPAGHLLFETGFDAIADEPSYLTGVPRTRWEGPLLRFVISPSDNVELDAEWVAIVGAAGEPGRSAVKDGGDVTLRAKWRIFGGGANRTAAAVRFGVTFPETSYNDKSFRALGLAPNTLRAYAQALASFPLARARVDANAGILLFDEVYRPHEQRDFLLYGLALVLPLGGAFEAVAEVAGRYGDGERGSDPSAEARAGVRIGRGRVRGDLAVRRGLAPEDGTWGGTAGLAWTIRPGKRPAAAAP